MVHVDGSEEAAEERPSVRLDHTAPRHANDFAVGNSYAVVAEDLVIVFSFQNLPTRGGPKSPPGEDISRFNLKLAQFKLQSEVSPIVQVSWATKTDWTGCGETEVQQKVKFDGPFESLRNSLAWSWQKGSIHSLFRNCRAQIR